MNTNKGHDYIEPERPSLLGELTNYRDATCPKCGKANITEPPHKCLPFEEATNTPDTEGMEEKMNSMMRAFTPRTPDTEWEKDRVNRMKQINDYLRNIYGLEDDSTLNAGEVEELCEMIVDHCLSSRDIRIKELEEEVDDLQMEIKEMGEYD